MIKKYRDYVWDIWLIGLANSANNFKSILLIPMLTKFLGAYDYGVWTQLKISIVFLLPFFTLGTGQAIIKFLAGQKNTDKIKEDFFSCLLASILISSAAAIVCFFLSGMIAKLILGSTEYQYLIKIFGLLLIFESSSLLLMQYLKGFRYIKTYFKILVFETIFELCAVVYVILMGYGILGALYALLLTRILFVFIRIFQIITKIGFKWPNFINLRKYIAFGMPLALSISSFFILNWGNRYLINYFLGLKAVGVYSVSYFLAYIVTFISSPIGYILFPTISSCVNRSKKKEAAAYLVYSLKYFFIAGIPLVFTISLLSKELLLLFSSKEFLSASAYLPLLLAGVFIFQVGVIGQYVIIIFNKNKLILRLYITLAIINTLLCIMLIPTMGLFGAALASLLSFIGYSIFNMLYSQRFIRYGIKIITLLKILLASFIMIVCLFLFRKVVPQVNTIFFIPAGALLYIISLYLFRCFSIKEIILFRSLFAGKKRTKL